MLTCGSFKSNSAWNHTCFSHGCHVFLFTAATCYVRQRRLWFDFFATVDFLLAVYALLLLVLLAATCPLYTLPVLQWTRYNVLKVPTKWRVPIMNSCSHTYTHIHAYVLTQNTHTNRVCWALNTHTYHACACILIHNKGPPTAGRH